MPSCVRAAQISTFPTILKGVVKEKEEEEEEEGRGCWGEHRPKEHEKART
jgi:hypothetical protein